MEDCNKPYQVTALTPVTRFGERLKENEEVTKPSDHEEGQRPDGRKDPERGLQSKKQYKGGSKKNLQKGSPTPKRDFSADILAPERIPSTYMVNKKGRTQKVKGEKVHKRVSSVAAPTIPPAGRSCVRGTEELTLLWND